MTTKPARPQMLNQPLGDDLGHDRVGGALVELTARRRKRSSLLRREGPRRRRAKPLDGPIQLRLSNGAVAARGRLLRLRASGIFCDLCESRRFSFIFS